MTKHCTHCNKEKELEEFYMRKDSKSTHRAECKLCFDLRILEKRHEKKLFAINYLGGKCIDCKQSFHPNVYDFHHLDPSKKEFAWIKLRTKSIDKLIKELDKCVLLCANCHRMRHIIGGILET